MHEIERRRASHLLMDKPSNGCTCLRVGRKFSLYAGKFWLDGDKVICDACHDKDGTPAKRRATK